MSEAIGPGSALVCVSDAMPGYCQQMYDGLEPLVVGGLYFCEEIGKARFTLCPWDGCGKTWISLRGKKLLSIDRHLWYCPNLFKPLNDGDISLVKDEINEVERYKAPPTITPVKVKEPVNGLK